MSSLSINHPQQVDEALAQVREAAKNAHAWIAAQSSDPMTFLKSVKFERHGYHPIDNDRKLNLIEQINQTFTYAVALEATRLLLAWHPEAEGFRLAPGATMSQKLDVMSQKTGLVGAETFAATSPTGNRKMDKDMAKMLTHPEFTYRYIFFASPKFNETARRERFERSGVQVWSIRL